MDEIELRNYQLEQLGQLEQLEQFKPVVKLDQEQLKYSDKSYYLAIELQLQTSEFSLADATEISKIDISDMAKYVKSDTIIKCINAIHRVLPNYLESPNVKEHLLSDNCTSLNELINVYKLLSDETATVIFKKMTTFGQLLGCQPYCTTDVQLSLLEDELVKRVSDGQTHPTIRVPLSLKRVHAAIYNRHAYERPQVAQCIYDLEHNEENNRLFQLPQQPRQQPPQTQDKKNSIFGSIWKLFGK